MTAQELAQKILARIKEADRRVEEHPEPLWRVAYPLALDEIETLCKEQVKGASLMPEEQNGTMPEQVLIEKLADKEHASWARWMDYLFNQCDLERGKDHFRYIIPHELVERWKRQVGTPYAELTEREKQSDRDEVAHILPIIKQYVIDHAEVHHHHYDLSSEQGINNLAQAIEQRIVSRMKYGRNPQIELPVKKEVPHE